jgi:hypothetical protein
LNDRDDLVERARMLFAHELAEPPALTLRGGCAVDSYDEPAPFDPALDEPTDAYLERHAYWAMPYLDARSWRHYLPRLVEYALAHPDDPAMVVEATIRSLRPPDRIPARLSTLDAAQRAVVVALLELIALGRGDGALATDAANALEEWWLPGAHLRKSLERPARAGPPVHREVGDGPYRLMLPSPLEGGGAHRIESEQRTVESWRGVLDDAYAEVIVTVRPLAREGWRDAVAEVERWLGAHTRTWLDVPGARKALRLDGTTWRYSPAEPEPTSVVLAQGGPRLVTVTLRGEGLERVAESFALVSDDHGG